MLVPPRAWQVCWVPGSFELPVVAKAMAKSGKFDAVICIGVVVREEQICGSEAGTYAGKHVDPLVVVCSWQ